MATGVGYKSYMQFVEETVYGTGVAAAFRYELISANVQPQMGTIPDPSLNNARSRRALYQGGLFYRGTILLRLNFDGLMKLFKIAHNNITTTVVEAAVSSDHICREGTLSPGSLTVELVEGDIPVGKAQRLLGLKILGYTVRGTAGLGADAMLQVELEVIAKDKVTNFTVTPALTPPGVNPVLFHHGLTIDNGTATAGIRVRSFEVSFATPLTDDRFYLGSKNIDEPLPNDFLRPTWRITEEFQDVNALAALQAATVGTPQLIFRGGALGANFYEFEMRSNKTLFTEHSTPVEGYGIILMTTAQEAYNDPTDAAALLVRFRNGTMTAQ